MTPECEERLRLKAKGTGAGLDDLRLALAALDAERERTKKPKAKNAKSAKSKMVQIDLFLTRRAVVAVVAAEERAVSERLAAINAEQIASKGWLAPKLKVERDALDEAAHRLRAVRTRLELLEEC